MDLTITPTKLRGTVTPPGSKSQGHRLLIGAALGDGVSKIRNLGFSKDILATMECLEALGAEFERGDEAVTVHGMGANAMSPYRRMAIPRLDCGESGSTLRFLMPVALAVRGGGVFTGRGRLMERPLGPYFDIFKEKGIFFEQKDGKLTIQGMPEPGVFKLPGDVSSQFFTGLLFALPLLGGPSALIPTTPLESEGYVDMTLEALGRFGVELAATMSLPPQFHTFGNQTYRPADVTVEADWSQAGFWYAARFLGSDVEVAGMATASRQGDRVIAEYDRRLREPGEVRLDLGQCPDLAPALAVMGALRAGQVTWLVNGGRLRLKESDRLAAITDVLTALGADAARRGDCLVLRGRESLAGGVADGHNDHRIAMMAAVAATRCREPVTVTGAECVDKSYPEFWREFERLGGQIGEDAG